MRYASFSELARSSPVSEALVAHADDSQEDFYYGEPLPGGGFAHVVRLGRHEVIVLHRMKYKAYNETPMKGNLGMSPNTWKLILKTAVAVASSAALGSIYKLGKAVDQRIDDHFEADRFQEPKPTTEKD